MNYSFNSRVRYSETGENGKLTLPGVLNYFQDCCTFHAESVGLGGDVLKARDRAWVLSSWQVIVDEYPAMGTEIKITTAPYDFKGFMGMRNFTIETMDGKKLAWANSNWTHLAISTGIPVRLTSADTDNYILGEKLEMDYAPRKIKLPDDMTSQESFKVQKHHLDTNHHVNNCQYICMAEDFLPEDFKVYQMRAEYKMQEKSFQDFCCISTSKQYRQTFCIRAAMYLKKVSCEEFLWGGCIPYVVTMELIYIGRNQEGLGNLWPFLMTESQIMFGCYLATGVLKEAWRKRRKTIWRIRGTVLILAGSMAVFLAVFDNQYAKEKQEMLDTTFYKQVTDFPILPGFFLYR